jgi:hypothetical protein
LTSDTFGGQSSDHPALDLFGKIPEFKYCAARVEPAAELPREAAE